MKTKKTIILYLFVLIPALSFGQKKVEFASAKDFVTAKVQELNMLMWENVMNGKVKAYPNDSLNRPLTVEEINDMISIEYDVYVPNPDNPDDPYDLIIKRVKVEIDAPTDFEGLSLSYDYQYENLTTSFRLAAIGPAWKPLTTSGIELSISPIFFLKINEFLSLLNDNERQFFDALISARDRIGDFQNQWINPQKNREDLGREIGHVGTSGQPYYHHFVSDQDSILGYYLSTILSLVVDRANQQKEPLFKDVKQKKKYRNVQNELQEKIAAAVPNPDNPDVPYDLVMKKLTVKFDLSMIENILLHQKRKKAILEFQASEDHSIYVSLPKLLKHASEEDQILIQAYLDWLE